MTSRIGKTPREHFALEAEEQFSKFERQIASFVKQSAKSEPHSSDCLSKLSAAMPLPRSGGPNNMNRLYLAAAFLAVTGLGFVGLIALQRSIGG